ncbi:hypothetical protein HRbin23_01470 [bacterium HR23]|nr:hypothetical protein HRbin23_01470 [bacterium HR23]
MREEDLWAVWARASPGWGFLPASDGHRYRVLYPGRLSRSLGPDFQDTVLLRDDGRLLKGDVEVHRALHGWEAHGHAGDPRYRGVLLHVVLRGALHFSPLPPHIDLSVALHFQGDGTAFPYVGAIPSKGCLHRWADARFRQRASAYARLIASLGADEALYRGLMEGMGYGANREPMRLLAEAVPYRVLRRVALPCPPDQRPLLLGAVLLGSGGLLLPESDLAPLWTATGLGAILGRGAWTWAGVRPANRPERRLWGMALLLDRWWEGGLLAGICGTVGQGPRRLEAALMVSSPLGGPALIGHQRARELVVSIVLPFLWAWAVYTGDAPLRRAVWGVWKTFPPPEENTVSRAMRALLPSPLPNTARLQQGLLAWSHRLGLAC